MSSFFNVLPVENQQGPGTEPGGPFRPPQWAGPQKYSISAVLPSNGNNSESTTFFFDAVFRADHIQELRLTDHPVQNGASITDHAYKLPARLVLEIGMSDVMARFQADQYTGAESKSISAFQTFEYLQSLRVPLTVNTRLKQYQNMEIEGLRAADDNRTSHALRALISFREIILGTVTTAPQSARPDQSNTTNDGTVPTQDIPPDLKGYLDNMGRMSSERGAQSQ